MPRGGALIPAQSPAEDHNLERLVVLAARGRVPHEATALIAACGDIAVPIVAQNAAARWRCRPGGGRMAFDTVGPCSAGRVCPGESH
jgi:hypothetical protein